MPDYKKINKQISNMYRKENTSQSNKLNSQINNYKTRLNAAGIDADAQLDKRNFIEKALNLPEGQNIIFDIFEIINRPQQALFTGWKEAQEGRDFWEGVKRGITGEETTQFKDILKNYGMEDTTYEDLIKQGEKEGFGTRLKALDLSDILGFTGDVLLDPMDVPLIPIKTASVAGKLTKGADAIDDIGDSLKAITKTGAASSDLVDKALKANKIANKADNIIDITDKISDTYKLISPTEGLGKLAVKGVKGTVKGADTLVEKSLKALDAHKGIDYAYDTAKWAADLGKTGEGRGLLEMYKGLKNEITSKFSTKLSKGARKSLEKNQVNEYLVRQILENNKDEILKGAEKTAKKLGKTTEEVLKDSNKFRDIVSQISVRDMLVDASKGRVKYTDDIYNTLVNLVDDIADEDLAQELLEQIEKTGGKQNMLQLGDAWDNIINNKFTDKSGVIRTKGKGIEDLFDKAKLESIIDRPSLLTMKEQKEIDALRKLYQEQAPEYYNLMSNFYNEANKTVGDYFESMSDMFDKYFEGNVDYARHQINETYNDTVRRLITDYGADEEAVKKFLLQDGVGSRGLGNSRFLKSREYNMSALEANKIRKQELKAIPGLSKDAKKFIDENIELFSDLYTSGIDAYIAQMPKLAKDTQMINDVLIKQGFGELGNMPKIEKLNDEIKALTKAGDTENLAKTIKEYNELLDNTPFRYISKYGDIPPGFVKLADVEKEKLVNTLKRLSNQVGNKDLANYGKLIANLDDIAIDPTVKNILEISSDVKGKSEFAKFYNGMLNYFKGNKTMSLTNQMNNIGGNLSNMYLSGMSTSDITKYVKRAYSDLYGSGGWERLLKEGLAGNLSGKDLEKYEKLTDFMKNVTLLSDEQIAKVRNLDDIITTIGSSTGTRMPLDKLRYGFAKLNADEDRLFKYAAYLKAVDDPDYVRKLGATTAGEAVKKVLFDPENLTAFERNTMKKVIPFYTFAKNNLAFQIDNIGRNTKQYNRLMKAYNSLIESTVGDGKENIADYLKDNMYIPIPGSKDANGNYKFLRMQIPFGELTELVGDPLQTLVNKSNPLIKLPYELATNKNTFSGLDIEKYPGEKSKDLPLLTKKQEQVLSDVFGLDVPLKQGARVIQDISSLIQGNGMPFNVTTFTNNVNQDAINKQYEQIDELQGIIKKYKAKGYNIATINELKEANKNQSLKQIQSRLNAINSKYR